MSGYRVYAYPNETMTPAGKILNGRTLDVIKLSTICGKFLRQVEGPEAFGWGTLGQSMVIADLETAVAYALLAEEHVEDWPERPTFQVLDADTLARVESSRAEG